MNAMQIETPPTEKRYEKPEGERRGLVIVNTGDGKGKSTAAFGLALRAHGRGKAVKIFQFMKVPTARFGEHRMFEQIGIPIEGLGDGFSWKSQDLEHSAQLARDGWEKARAAILSGEYFMVVLDEITYPLIYGWLPLEGVLQTLRERPKDVHVCLTGRKGLEVRMHAVCAIRCRHHQSSMPRCAGTPALNACLTSRISVTVSASWMISSGQRRPVRTTCTSRGRSRRVCSTPSSGSQP